MTLKSKLVYWTLFRPKYWAESPPGRASSSRSNSAGAERRSMATSASGADQQLRGIVPQSLELVERAGLGMEEMDHEVHEIEQHPAAAGESFDMVGVVSPAVELLDHRLRDAADVRVGGARRDHEVVGGVGQP